MRSKPVKAPVIKKMGSFLHARLQKEIESSRKNISGLKKSIRGLQNKDRRLHRYGTRLVRKIDGRLAVNRKSIEDAENRLKSKEKKYSNLKARDFALQKTLVCLSGAEIKDLKKCPEVTALLKDTYRLPQRSQASNTRESALGMPVGHALIPAADAPDAGKPALK